MENAAKKEVQMTKVEGWGILVNGDHLLCQIYYSHSAATIACHGISNAQPVRVRLALEPRDDNVTRLRPRLVVSKAENLDG